MIYTYNDLGKLGAVFFDWTDLKYHYHAESGVLSSIRLANRIAFNYTCNMLFQPPGALVKDHHVDFNNTGFNLLPAKYK